MKKAAVIFLLLLLTGCGQYGPLQLPEKQLPENRLSENQGPPPATTTT